MSYQDYALEQSTAHAQKLRKTGLSPTERASTAKQAEQSLIDQVALEAGDTEDFDEYVVRFHRALKRPGQT